MSYRGARTSRSIGNREILCNPQPPRRVLLVEDTARLESFKAYDVRGKVPEQLNAADGRTDRPGVRRVHPSFPGGGRVTTSVSRARRSQAHLTRGLVASRASTWWTSAWWAPRRCTTPRSPWGWTGGSWSPPATIPREYNGMKFTREQARPISSDTGLFDIEERVRVALRGRAPQPAVAAKPGRRGAQGYAAGVRRAPSHLCRSGRRCGR